MMEAKYCIDSFSLLSEFYFILSCFYNFVIDVTHVSLEFQATLEKQNFDYSVLLYTRISSY
jgi:hypothetical protein